ncbi:PA domain-containing protein [Actinomadura sp. 6N118]|uniref:PA domain-containing protein n=1 Tax=Actinomadura sp. 6N118 TaxID=3375151 RepID=UPI00379F0AB9
MSRGVDLIGKAKVTNPAGTGNQGRVADVSAYGDHAFLTAFREPTCERAGAHVMNIANPSKPYEVTSAFMETTPNNYAGEGSQTLRVKNKNFDGVLFIHQNETCPGAPAPTEPRTRGGINIWDVSDATKPELLVKHAGDYTDPEGADDDQANQTHSAFAWTNTFDGRTYVVLVDDEETTDLDILDITDPANPVLVNDTLDLNAAPFNVSQDSPPNLTSSFSHDMVVKRIGERYVMNVNYWDGGYVLLDVTDPRPDNVKLIAESDYAQLDEQRLLRGHKISPEGNGHQSELSPDNTFLIGTDEDFNPYRVTATITSGPYQGTGFTAVSASDTPPVDADTSITGTPAFVGTACAALPAGSGVALIERGGCNFQVKFDTIKAAGYSAGIVFNSQPAVPSCQGLVNMLVEGDLPFVFVDRLTGLRLLQVPGVTAENSCDTATPAAGAASASATIEAIFDGWGYIRLFKTKIRGDAGAPPGSIEQTDTFAIPESQDPKYATGFGDLSVHEVAVDPNPDRRLVYVSYYAGGFRILKYGDKGLKEVGAFIDKGGNNFWGVEVHNIRGKQYVLASDRDFGLYIFRPGR